MHLRSLFVAAVLLASAQAVAVPCPDELPVLFVVQDKSNSMWAVPSASCSTCPRKWESSKVAVSSLATSFSNRFRFGLQMYPRDATSFNCNTGTVRSPVPADAAAIETAYETYYPGGGTPTAASLLAARTYLDGLNLSNDEPAYVLLITDGLPNCSASLNPQTCGEMTTGCASSGTCESKDCLDDQASAAAAAALWAAGYKVYVVGFGSEVSADNDKRVLDAIARAGGSGQALVATDQNALIAALEQVAFDASTCCEDVCAAGSSQCVGTNSVKRCQLDPSIGCTTWTVSTCPNQSACVNGACQTCTNVCTAGATRCSGDTAERCSVGANGCTSWVEADECGWGEVCANGACVSCESCTAGSSHCVGTSVERCIRDLWTGCTDWERSACPNGAVCTNGNCESCATECTAGAKRCVGDVPETCVADPQGCTSWQAGARCTDFCSGGACGTCGTDCALNEVRCNGSTVERCAVDSNDCPVWEVSDRCEAGELCVNGRCEPCPVQCAAGERRCVGTTVETCLAQADGCNAWAASACAPGQICLEGACTQPCSDACTEGELQCDLQGVPQACERAPNGCTVWMSGAECAEQTVCHQGLCRQPCSGGEIETCPKGFICTGLPEGRLCMPREDEPVEPPEDPIDDPSDDPGAGEVDPIDGEPATASVGGGCGCGAAGGTALALLVAPFALAALRRRR